LNYSLLKAKDRGQNLKIESDTMQNEKSVKVGIIGAERILGGLSI
jgi:hypothetical protein